MTAAVPIVVGGEGWHEGVKGIVASRIVNRYHVPAILFSISDGVAHGSGRSVGSVNLFEAVEKCADLCVRFGGHAGAVGVTIDAENLDAFRERLEAVMAELPEEQFVDRHQVAAIVGLDELDVPTDRLPLRPEAVWPGKQGAPACCDGRGHEPAPPPRGGRPAFLVRGERRVGQRAVHHVQRGRRRGPRRVRRRRRPRLRAEGRGLAGPRNPRAARQGCPAPRRPVRLPRLAGHGEPRGRPVRALRGVPRRERARRPGQRAPVPHQGRRRDLRRPPAGRARPRPRRRAADRARAGRPPRPACHRRQGPRRPPGRLPQAPGLRRQRAPDGPRRPLLRHRAERDGRARPRQVDGSRRSSSASSRSPSRPTKSRSSASAPRSAPDLGALDTARLTEELRSLLIGDIELLPRRRARSRISMRASTHSASWRRAAASRSSSTCTPRAARSCATVRASSSTRCARSSPTRRSTWARSSTASA